MSKNVIIGLLVAVVVIAGGYYIMKNNATTSQVVKIPDTGNPTPQDSTTSPLVINLKPDVPVVQTSSDYSVSSSTVVVGGKVKPNGAFTSYWFDYGPTTALGSRTAAQQIGSGFALISAPAYITGLQANTNYYFRLSAKNAFATVNGSTFSFQTNNAAPFVVVTPKANTNNATNILRTTANLNGSVNPSGYVTNYWFEYGKDNNLGNVTAFQATNNGISTMSVATAISGLEPLTKYYFRMNAQNQYGTSNGSILNFTTTGPAAPSAPTVSTNNASNIGSTTVKLNGRINPNGTETNYWFEYSTDSLIGSLISTGASIETLPAGNNSVDVNQDLSGLSKNLRYYYRLVGRNSSGTIYGNILSFKTKS